MKEKKNHSLLYWNKHQLLWDVTAIKRIRGWWPSLPSHMSTGKSNSSSSVSCFLPFKNTSGNMIRFVKLKEVSRLKNYHNNLVFVFVFHCCDTLKGRNIYFRCLFSALTAFCEAWVHKHWVSISWMHGQEQRDSNHTTYQRFTGTLKHVADILAQPRLWWLPTDKAKVINMLYTLAEGKEVQYYRNTFS